MSNGICILAQNNKTTDYVRQAYALALSVLANDPGTNISLITNDTIPDYYKNVFDKIIPIPWGDMAKGDWKIENRWKVYHVTPYRNTIVFDTDMLILDSLSNTWDWYNLAFTNQVKTYRNEIVTSNYYRKTFVENELPNIYTGMYQFSKCESTRQFFVLLDIIIKNWEIFYKKYAPKSMQRWCSFDLSVAIAVKILDLEGYVLNNSNMLSFTHMKPMVQNLSNISSKWLENLTVDYGNNDIYINGFKQSGVLHYVDDDFLSSDMLAWLEEKV